MVNNALKTNVIFIKNQKVRKIGSPPKKTKVKMNHPPELKKLHPPPKQFKDKKISAGVTEFFRDHINEAAYKKGMSQAGFILAAIDNYLNPKAMYVKGGHTGEFGIDRTPKGITATPKTKLYFGTCMVAFKQEIARANSKGKSIQKTLLIAKGELEIEQIKVENVPSLSTLHANVKKTKDM